MDWLKENALDIFGVIGALYALALTIVKLTPTPRDDDALEKVAGPVKLIAAIFGLTLKQGIESKPSVPPTTHIGPDAGTVNWLCGKCEGGNFPKHSIRCSKRNGRALVDVLVILMVAMVLFSGCVSSGEKYQASAAAFSAAVDTAADANSEGMLDDDAIMAIDAAIDVGQEALHRWADALARDEDYPDGARLVTEAIGRIRVHLGRE